MPNTQDRAEAVAALIRETPSADRDALICSIGLDALGSGCAGYCGLGDQERGCGNRGHDEKRNS